MYWYDLPFSVYWKGRGGALCRYEKVKWNVAYMLCTGQCFMPAACFVTVSRQVWVGTYCVVKKYLTVEFLYVE
jgi:hypothetical protein